MNDSDPYPYSCCQAMLYRTALIPSRDNRDSECAYLYVIKQYPNIPVASSESCRPFGLAGRVILIVLIPWVLVSSISSILRLLGRGKEEKVAKEHQYLPTVACSLRTDAKTPSVVSEFEEGVIFWSETTKVKPTLLLIPDTSCCSFHMTHSCPPSWAEGAPSWGRAARWGGQSGPRPWLSRHPCG